MNSVKEINTIKIITIGDIGVGKQSIIKNFCGEQLKPEVIGSDLTNKIIQIDGIQLKLQLWHMKFRSSFQNRSKGFYFKRALGIIFVYDVTNRESFQNCMKEIAQVPDNVSNLAIKLIVGNKCDLEESRVVSYEEGQQIANQHGLQFFETSGLRGQNVDEVMNYLLSQIKEKSLFSIDQETNITGIKLYDKTISQVQKQGCF